MAWLRLNRAVSDPAPPLVAAFLLSLAIWVSGPLLVVAQNRPLDAAGTRLIVIALVWLGLAAAIRGRHQLRRRREAAFLRDLAAIDPTLPWGTLGGATGARPLHERPWYLVIGPPGVGKTAAILNSGLSFAPDPDAGGGGQAGRGWQILPAEEAVLIEISGGAIPQALTDLLKSRRGQPALNGIILMASLTALADDADGQPVRSVLPAPLLTAIDTGRGARIPVWVLLTRADLIAGFSESFPHGSPAPDHFGFRLPASGRGPRIDPAVQVAQGFDALVSRLRAQVADSVAVQSDPATFRLAIGFPPAMSALRPRLTEWLAQIFPPDLREQTVVLQGVWFCSGGGGGRQIDPLRPVLLRSFGLTRQLPQRGNETRTPMFVNGFFHRILLPEAGQTGALKGWKRVAPFAAALCLGLGLAVPLVQHHAANEALIARVAQQVKEVERLIPQGAEVNSDPLPVLAVLDRLRRLPGAPEGEVTKAPDPSAGLYVDDLLQNGARLAYRDGLNRLLLPRLLLRLEEVMQSRVNEPEVIFSALRTYLMLGQAGLMVPSQVLDWFAADWAEQGGDALSVAQRARLALHLGDLLRQPMQPVALDDSLITQMRGVLARLPQARRIYAQLVIRAAADAPPPFRVDEAAGPGAAEILRRPSGAGLTEGVEGFYTRQGFHQVFLPHLSDLGALLQNEAWVLGPARLPAAGDQAQRAVVQDVLGIYYRDYIARYEALLGDIDIIPFENPQHAAEGLRQLSQPDSPLLSLLNAIARQSLLSLPDDATATGAAEAGAGMRDGRGDAPGSDSLGAVVEGHFRALRDLVNGTGGQPSAFERVRAVLADPRDGSSGRIGAAVRGGSSDPSRLLDRWLMQIRAVRAAPEGSGLRSRLTQLWQSEVLPLCEKVTQGGYPFQPGAQAEVHPEDFLALFGPEGALERFFQTYLTATEKAETDQNGSAQEDPALAPFVIAAFDRAAQIRDGFFAADLPSGAGFRLRPHHLGTYAPDAQIQRVALEVDGHRTAYGPEDFGDLIVPWPGRSGGARISLEPEREGGENSLHRHGPWALIRLLSAAEMRPSTEGGTLLLYRIGGRSVSFSLKSRGRFEDTLAALATFKCPQSF
ncbi:type VI secretion system membrane subunit TssM [Falsigemmobacter intermedius]|uniref:type VI secretion system membrane subunit TssM n=1 Tax=Falsigemmobacter intermedius TaxID=1553448 RepID=UPI003EFFC786